MQYYEVWVASPQYHSDKALTYKFVQQLPAGSVVNVPLRNQTVVGVISKSVPRPAFDTKEVLRVVSDTPIPTELLNLIHWLKDYYPAPFGQLVSLILPSTLTGKIPDVSKPSDVTDGVLPPLTPEQHQTVAIIRQSYPRSLLVHGDTGTGKTRLYLEAAKETLRKGRSAILLTPEIGLTPQLALAAESAFPGRTIVMHSDLGPAKRREAWLRILESDKPLVVIGPRSALFTPVRNAGLIVIDECHETSYKQEQPPHYLASRVAAKLAALSKAQLILGSATPNIQDYYAFQKKKLTIARMKQQAVTSELELSDISLIDLKDREQFNISRWLADDLVNAVNNALQQKQQSLLFINRRGTARLILCQLCGWQAMCPRCDLPLTFHGDTFKLQCHTCGFQDKPPMQCQSCSAKDIVFRNIGTKALVAEIQRLFPKAVIGRFDSDTAKKDRLEEQYKNIRDGKIDILIGTQMLGKGLDLPRLSVLGVITADSGLSFPDFSAEERTFQLLTQVIGRVHRGHVQGKVFIQTYHPESSVIRSAITKDYENFYTQQLAERQMFGFPPFRFLLKLTCTRSSSTSAKKASQKLADEIRQNFSHIEVIGPSPAFTEKVQNRFRWQLIVKSVDRSILVDIIRQLPAKWSYDIDPINLL